MTDSQINANVYGMANWQPSFPEQNDPVISGRANCGICFSGGGTRALASTAGQLRGLTKLGLVENARYISCVSGGSWASGAYTFLPDSYSEDDFLGPHFTSGQRGSYSLDDWGNALNDSQLVKRAAVDFSATFWAYMEQGPDDMAWINTVRDTYYAPFGLGDNLYFAASDQNVTDIVAHNPQLSASDFHVPRANRPYLIVNGTLEWPVFLFDGVQRVLVQFTPGYVGNPFSLRLHTEYLFKDYYQNTGGGFLDSFAFGSSGPNASAGSWLSMPAPDAPSSIWHASGISSTAFGFAAARIDLTSVIPREEYWAVTDAASSQTLAAEQKFTDGGNLENFGLMAMLQRKVEKLVVFVDSEDVLPDNADKVMEDSDVTPLFGLDNASMPNNQVFDSSEYKPLLQGWIDARNAGGLAMVATTLTVMENDWFGIEGGWDVDILWVYTAPVGNWIDQLSGSVTIEVERGIEGYEPLAHFPNYRTADENKFDSIDLTAPQAALLADMYAWAIEREASAFAAHLPSA